MNMWVRLAILINWFVLSLFITRIFCKYRIKKIFHIDYLLYFNLLDIINLFIFFCIYIRVKFFSTILSFNFITLMILFEFLIFIIIIIIIIIIINKNIIIFLTNLYCLFLKINSKIIVDI